MTAAVIIERLTSFGAKFFLDGEQLLLDLPEDFPSSHIEEVRQAKAEIIEYMKKEIGWRVEAMQRQMAGHQGGYVPMLMARDGITGRKGFCFSCIEPINQSGSQYICQLCILAKRAVLQID